MLLLKTKKPYNMYKKVLFNTRTVVALALRVFAENNKTVCKGNPDQESNKEVVAKLLTCNVVPSDSEYILADELITAIKQRLMLNELSGSTIKSSFVNTVLNYVVADQVPLWASSFIVWAPKVVQDLDTRDTRALDLQCEAISSEYFGSPGEKLELLLTVKECRFVTHIGKFNALAKTQSGNFVSFWIGAAVDGEIAVKGKVKGHRVNQYAGNAKTTLLNFVKVVK